MKLENFISKITKILARSTQICEGPKAAFPYSDLTPTTDCDEKAVCCNALEWALQNTQIKNIALSGPYGSGKSSILMKFKGLYGAKYRCIDISLASFPTTERVEKELIEMSILQQIFYCEHARHIPDSRFKRIKHLASKSLFWKSLGLASWILICLFPIYFPHIVPEINPTIKTYVLIVWLFTSLLGLAHFTAKLLRSVNGRKISRFSIKNGEIELCKDSDPSILNKHLDEILYFFEVTQYNVVIIEDLDRFKNPDIFTKLREINLLLNRSQQIGRRIVFIYAVRDDLFQDKNRTKFFDFIIPIIPVINPTNASDVLSQKLGGAELSSHLIDDISLYVDDMRLLKNICNEYFMYRDNLGAELNRDKIFALIVYKNLFPSDFAALHLQKGAVYDVFARKPEFAQQLIQGIEQQIANLNAELKAIENLQFTDIKDLRILYLYEIQNHISENATALKIGGERVAFDTLKKDGFPTPLINASKIEYYYNTYNGEKTGTNASSFYDIEQKVNPDMGYQEREKLLIAKSENRTDKIKVEIERLEAQKTEIQSRSLQQLLEEVEDIRIFEEDTPNASLIVYLLRNGYIDEDYPYYISLFHEGSRTKADQTYLLSIKNRKALPPNHKLDRIDNLLKHIQDKELGRKEIFNDSLTDYLSINSLDYDKQVFLYFDQLSNGSAVSLDYIDHYMATGSKKPEFIRILANRWPTWWDFIVGHSDRYSEARKDSYFLLLLQHIDTDDLVIQDKNKNISNYILAKNDFLTWALKAHNEEKIKQIVDELDIYFAVLETPATPNTILDYIYENRYYTLNQDMISLFLQVKGNNIQLESLLTANYSTILTSGCTHLIEYIEEMIDVYVADVFLQLETNTEETQESCIRLLNNETLSKADKIAIVKKENTQLDDITDVLDPELWSHLVEQHRILPTWGNVVAYYQHCEGQIDDTLTAFLNEPGNYVPLSKVKFITGHPMKDEFQKSFALALILNAELEDESYSALLKSIPSAYSQWDIINIENLSNIKIDRLIQAGFLSLTADNYTLLKEHFTNKHVSLLEYHSKQFNSFVNLVEFDSEDIHLMLQSKIFNRVQKIQLIYSIDEALIIGHEPAGALAGQLLYEAKDQSEISFTLLKHLIKSTTGPEQKVMLMLWHWDTVQNEDHITALLQACGSPYRELTKSQTHPKFERTAYNELLAEKLKEVDYISSHSGEKNPFRMHAKQR